MTRAAYFISSIIVTKIILTSSFGMLPLPHKEIIIRNKKYTFSIRASKSDEQSPKDHIPQLNLLDNSSLDSELRPKRLPPRNGKRKKIQNMSHELVGNARNREWGVETIDDPSQRPQCPKSFEEVAEEAFTAISSTLYSKQKLDPNIASNAMAVSIHDKRPVGFAYFPAGRDVGRLGIEIDGARFLLSESSNKSNENQDTMDANSPQRDLASYDIANSINGRMLSPRKYGQHTVAMEGRALRRYSIILAAKLSQGHWAGLEDNIDSEHGAEVTSRPVALFFNTIRQALMASKELQLLQKVAKVEKEEGKYDNIRILCLGQDEIPKDMLQKPTTDLNGKKRRKWGGSKALSEGFVNPKNGIILIVQPTDYNNEANPASPVIGTVQQLQKLAAAASIAHLPTVAISPRLTEQFDGNGIEQSGYQKSSTYGGIEPPKGPTPWILRDFIPPVYSWIGNTIELSKRPPSPSALDNAYSKAGEFEMSYLSRVAITQSVMNQGHPWSVFVVESVYCTTGAGGAAGLKTKENKYHFLASTKSKAGRPTRQIILDILSDWA